MAKPTKTSLPYLDLGSQEPFVAAYGVIGDENGPILEVDFSGEGRAGFEPNGDVTFTAGKGGMTINYKRATKDEAT